MNQTALPALTDETSPDTGLHDASQYQAVAPTDNQTQSLLVLMSSTTEQILPTQTSPVLSFVSHRLDERKAVHVKRNEPIQCEKYNRCGRSTCIHCQTIYQGKKTKEITKNIKEKDLIRIILTVKSSPDDGLKDLTDKLYRCFKQLRRTSYWKKNIIGGLTRLHIDHTGTCWHPHFDVIAEPNAESDLTEAKLSMIWESITSDSQYINIQSVTPTELSHLKLSTYILKPSFKSLVGKENLIHVYSVATKGKRKLQRFGHWTNTKKRKDWKK